MNSTDPAKMYNNVADTLLKVLMRFFSKEWSGALLAIIILAGAIEIVTDGRPFLSPSNLFTILNNAAPLGIVAAGMTLVILTAGIDLSVGSVVGLCGALTGYVVSYLGFPPLMAIAFGLGIGITIGLIHGSFIAYLGMPAFIVTLAGLSIWRGTAHLATEARATPQLPSVFDYFGRYNPFAGLREAFKAGELDGFAATIGGFVDANWISFFRTFQMSAILLILVFIILALIVSNSKFGRYVYAIGSNTNGARQAGIPTRRYIVLTYAVGSFCAALGALMFLGRAPYAKSDYGSMWELDAIAAVVIGGTSLFGGRGSLWGTFMGVILLKVINNGLTLAQLNTFWQMVVTGLIIVLAITLDIVRQSRDPLLLEKFLKGLAAAMTFIGLMFPAGQWIVARLALARHDAMQALRETGASLAPTQANMVQSPQEINDLAVQASVAATPAFFLACIFALTVATIFVQQKRLTMLCGIGLGLAAVSSLFGWWSAIFPFMLLALIGMGGSLVVPMAAARLGRQ